jgi:GH18 family chitinase
MRRIEIVVGIVAVILLVALALVVGIGIVVKEPVDEPAYVLPSYEVMGLSGSEGDECVITFGEIAKVNTLVLEEKLLPLPVGVDKPSRMGVNSFSLYYKDGEEYKHFYTQDFIHPYRYCSFPTVTTDEIKITVDNSSNLDWELTSVTPKFVEKTYKDDFEVAAYITLQSGYDIRNYDKNHFSIITTVYLSFLWFNEYGEVFMTDDEHNGVMVDGEEIVATVISNIRKNASEDVKIIPVFIGRDHSGEQNAAYVHSQGMGPYKETLASQIKDFIEKYDLDGASFDYEYPANSEDNKIYYEFCTYLRSVLGEDMFISGATCHWMFIPFNLMMQAGKNIMTMDRLEIMSYDLRDGLSTDAYHSTFQNGAYDQYVRFKDLEKEGEEWDLLRGLVYGDKDANFPLSKINLGLPFYSRPLSLEAYWGEYKYNAHKLGKFGNLTENDTFGKEYFNSWQMIYDKTAYAIDQGFGGVMVWNYACDLPMNHECSLFSAIKAAIDSRK